MMVETVLKYTPEQLMEASDALWIEANRIQVQSGTFSFVGHEYQIDWFGCDHPIQFFIKGAQIGCTDVQVLKSLRGMIKKKYPQGVLYTFPTGDDVTDFSKARFKPLIEKNPETIGQYVQNTDAVTIKQIHSAMLYLRGARASKVHAGVKRTSTKLKSVPVDRIVKDERDEMEEAMIDLMDARKAHTAVNDGEGEDISLSTPTIPDYGIDADYQLSDGRVWMIRCDKCRKYTCLELEFPNCLHRVDDHKVIRICAKCRDREIYPRNGRWVAQWPSQIHHGVGWWISQLNSLPVNPKKILDRFENPKSDTQLSETYNSSLGKAYIQKENQLTENQIFAVCNMHAMDMGHPGPCGMGVDVGSDLYVVIGYKPYFGGIRIIKLARVKAFTDVWDLAKRFGVRSIVFDLYPETRKVRDFIKVFEHDAWGCEYAEHQSKSYNWIEREQTVKVNRTEVCDATHKLIDERPGIEIPRRCAEVEVYAKQMCKIAKVLEKDEDTGKQVYRYRKLGPDHYRHATNYLHLACEQLPEYSGHATFGAKAGLSVGQDDYFYG